MGLFLETDRLRDMIECSIASDPSLIVSHDKEAVDKLRVGVAGVDLGTWKAEMRATCSLDLDHSEMSLSFP